MLRCGVLIQWALMALSILTTACGTGSPTPASPGIPPASAFTFTPSAPRTGQAISFTDSSTHTPTAWAWNFGDGTTATVQNPSHTYANPGTYAVSLSVTNAAGTATVTRSLEVAGGVAQSWRFAMVGDTHVTATQQAIPAELVTAILADAPKALLVAGDLVEGGSGATSAQLEQQLRAFLAVVAPLKAAGIGVYPIRGNHEADAPDNLTAWNRVFSGTETLPTNGPSGETNLSYAFSLNNALFIGLDNYVNLHRVNQAWLDAQLSANRKPHVFVFGHEGAFKTRHDDILDDSPTERNTFWQSLTRAGARTYLCGHDHFADVARIDEGDGNPANDAYQFTLGSGGGDLFTQYQYNGDNSPFTPVGVFHDASTYGYLLVELSGTDDADLGVTLTWKKRSQDPVTGTVTYVPAYTFSYTAAGRSSDARSYAVVDTGQVDCFNTTTVISAPLPGQAFHGQDAQTTGLKPSYQDHGDGTVSDLNTGLMWVKARGSKLTWAEALRGASACRVGGYSDWRMPTLKELYSLIQFTGAQGPSMTSTAGYLPFIDTSVFEFTYGAGTSTERVIDCQDWSGSAYVSTTMQGVPTAFGVNFADGRIKGYGSSGTTSSPHFVRYVRGNPAYGQNQFRDNGDGTITDQATGLMWSQADSGTGLDWQVALAWVQQQNAAKYLGHSDWRLPNAKELQSILDYTRAPDAPAADHRGPAIDPVFQTTAITNEGGALDYPFYWTSTSFRDGSPNEIPAAYVCFGRALGWMKLNGATTYQLLDVHGAGAQRSDPKAGGPTDHFLGYDATGKAVYGRGPQGDVTRIANFVRLVRSSQP